MTKEAVGFVGLGKLGLPCALAMSVKLNQDIYGFDVNSQIAGYIRNKKVPYLEQDIETFLEKGKVDFQESLAQLVKNSTVIFFAVQTPHEPKYEGNIPVPDSTKDFEYSFLVESVRSVCEEIEKQKKENVLLVVISTVLPGTMRREVLPIIGQFNRNIQFVYNPFFIAMGTTIPDYLNPEFVLMGSDSEQAMIRLEGIYEFIEAPKMKMKIESAELTKVAYNTFIGFKIVFANTINEICEKLGGNSDEVTSALSNARSRLMSSKYLSAGMADGGGCHPRDQIAMSHLAKHLNLTTNCFDWLARARDAQTLGQARLIKQYQSRFNLRVYLLGRAYKKNVNLTVGSPADLLSHFLDELEVQHSFVDPLVEGELDLPSLEKGLYFVSCNHDLWRNVQFPSGSIVIDPWGNSINKKQDDITYVTPGR